MKAISKGRGTNILAVFSIAVIMVIIITTVFMRFPRYDPPTLPVKPQHYKIEIITKEDYNKLSNQENGSVELPNNTTQTAAETSDPYLLPYYKSINDGSQYVLVAIRRNATFMNQWYHGIIPIFCTCIIGLFLGLKRKRLEEQQKIDALDKKDE
jgi:hypothetical protein